MRSIVFRIRRKGIGIWLTGGDGYICTNEPVLHCGVGEHQRIDGVTVRWPGGDRETWDAMPINQRVLPVEGHEGLERVCRAQVAIVET